MKSAVVKLIQKKEQFEKDGILKDYNAYYIKISNFEIKIKINDNTGKQIIESVLKEE